MTRVINFNPGPSALPLSALELARDELLDFEGSGMSIMEHSHRGKQYESVHNEVLQLIRELLRVPSTHSIVLQTGGAHQQFATVPMNFLRPGASADYVLTGGWSERAYEEALRVGSVRVAATTKTADGFTRIPTRDELQFDPAAAYAHITTNNTLYGTQWHALPETGKTPLVLDMCSDFMSRPMDVSSVALLYAGAQKNLGPAGVTVVIVDNSFLATARTDLPMYFQYATHVKNNSLYNTPPSFVVYMARNVLRWIKSVGGLETIETWNREKARLLYAAIDAHPNVFQSKVEVASRSWMNAVFRLHDAASEENFLQGAKKRNMVGLKGHRSVGGIRVSMYNAIRVDEVQALVEYMHEFARAQG